MFKTILLPIDLEQDGSWGRALSVAARIAKQEGARLHLVTVIQVPPAIVAQYLPSGYEGAATKAAAASLEAIAGNVDIGEGSVTTHVLHGVPYREILKEAERIGAELIVLESNRPGMVHFLLGSNAARIVRHARCSVFVLRSGDR